MPVLKAAQVVDLFPFIFAWCDDATHQKEYKIKTRTKETGKLEAAFAEASSDIENSNAQIMQLPAEISSE